LLGFVVAVPLASGAESGPYPHAHISCPRTAYLGDTLIIKGSGFQPTAAVTGAFTAPATGTFSPTTTTSSGSFTTTATISPTSPTGSQELTVVATGAGQPTVTEKCKIRILA